MHANPEESAVGGSQVGSNEPLDVLRAKYLDYCSAQVADLLLYLSPDEIYLLAQRAHRERGEGGDLSYVDMVELATQWLSRKVSLPPFEVWLTDYREHPERYDEYLLGLWKSDAEEVGDERL